MRSSQPPSSFLLPGRSAELWPNINAAGFAALAYLAVLVIAFLRRADLSVRRRVIVTAIAVVGIGGTIFSWKQMDRTSHWQRQTLNEIATVIGRGIYLSMLPDSLLPVLDAYHQQSGGGRRTLGAIYRQHFPPGEVGDAWSTLAPTGMANPQNDVFLTEISDTHVVVVARHPWYHGNDAGFANAPDGQGRVQVRALLTEKGLRYVTEN